MTDVSEGSALLISLIMSSAMQTAFLAHAAHQCCSTLLRYKKITTKINAVVSRTVLTGSLAYPGGCSGDRAHLSAVATNVETPMGF